MIKSRLVSEKNVFLISKSSKILLTEIVLATWRKSFFILIIFHTFSGVAGCIKKLDKSNCSLLKLLTRVINRGRGKKKAFTHYKKEVENSSRKDTLNFKVLDSTIN